MPILVRGLTLELDEPEDLLVQRAAARLRVHPEDIRNWAIARRSLDARKHRVQFTYSLELALAGPRKREAQLLRRLHRNDVVALETEEVIEPRPGNEPLRDRPIVVGFGPAGMFAGYLLAQYGYRPLILERGHDVTTRHRDIMVDFYRNGIFHPESNLLFGEGGAGAYSDGKLYTRLHDPRVRAVLEVLYQHGADPDILIDGKPHIGSDRLPGICRRIRQRIESLGGEVRFGARLEDVAIEDGKITAITTNGRRLACGPVLMAIGHSARDTLRMLAGRGINFETKPFQLGVRIEHPQEMVNRWQFGNRSGHVRLPPADYQLVAKGAAGQHGDVFSFCMCPGGMLLPTNESAGHIVTNGASRSNRGGPLANAGLVVTLDPQSVCPEARHDPLAGLAYQERLERAAFGLTGGTYQVPAQRASDFLAGRRSDGKLETSYPLGGQWVDLRELLPSYLSEAIANGLAMLDRRLPGFGGPDALLAAPETRASGPVRMVRDPHTRQSVSTGDLYPLGEGAGYAGGIVSAAIDGLKTAELLIARYAPPQAV